MESGLGFFWTGNSIIKGFDKLDCFTLGDTSALV